MRHEKITFSNLGMPLVHRIKNSFYVAYEGCMFKEGEIVVSYVHPYKVDDSWRYKMIFFVKGGSVMLPRDNPIKCTAYRALSKISEEFLIQYWVREYGYDLRNAFTFNPDFKQMLNLLKNDLVPVEENNG